jgi:hypothetical protein
MDDHHFDDLARRMALSTSRRALLRCALAMTGATVVAALRGRSAAAKPNCVEHGCGVSSCSQCDEETGQCLRSCSHAACQRCNGSTGSCESTCERPCTRCNGAGRCLSCEEVYGVSALCCDGACTVASDPRNCGACGNACGALGTCVPTFDADHNFVGYACRSLPGGPCSSAEQCYYSNGFCCDGICRQLDLENCEGCGLGCGEFEQCFSQGGPFTCCADAELGATCGTGGPDCCPGQFCCDGVCILQSRENCGGCGVTCAACEVCAFSEATGETSCQVCGAVPEEQQICCDDVCISAVDQNNCGSCGAACGACQLCAQEGEGSIACRPCEDFGLSCDGEFCY